MTFAASLRPLSLVLPPKDEYESARELDPIITPYKDNPDSGNPYGDDINTQPFDSADMLESQRLMMQGRRFLAELDTLVSLTWYALRTRYTS